MNFDAHVHVAALGRRDDERSRAFRKSRLVRHTLRRLGLPRDLPAGALDDALSERLGALLSRSSLDGAVLLALDAVYDERGVRVDADTQLEVGNDFVASLAARMPKACWGASVHPYRRDAVDELDRVAARGAVLVKWLPSAQGIAPDDPRCFPFYDALVRLQLPLLCHTGNEHTLSAYSNALNDPRRLIPALERGVTVIAAHCGARLYLQERCHLAHWRRLTARYQRLFGDVSAFGVATRVGPLRRLLASPQHCARLVYGSDFPISPWPLSCLGGISLRQAWAVRRIANPFDQTLALMRALGVPTDVFSRGAALLRPQLRLVVPAALDTMGGHRT